MSAFKGKACLVTGAASGVGLAVCQALAAQQATIFLADIDPAGEAAAREMGAQFVRLDVSDYDAWQRLASDLPQIDYLHLNAGIQIAPPDAPLGEYAFASMQLQRYRTMMGVNVDGVVFGLHSLLPNMRAGGSIVVTASLAGITPYEIDPLYAMSKHAVAGLVRSLAGTCRDQGLTINALCPGGIDTNIIPHQQRVADAVFMTPQNIAQEVLHLFQTDVNGKTWAKVSQSKPAWIIRAPGDKG